jgi:hypothetical protein
MDEQVNDCGGFMNLCQNLLKVLSFGWAALTQKTVVKY